MLTLTDYTLADLMPAEALRQYTVRTEDAGVHVSAIAAAAVRAAKPGDEYAPASDTGRALHFLKGLAFEDVLGRAFADRTCRLYRPNGWRPGEITIPAVCPLTGDAVDVIGTPDWCDVDEKTGEFYTDDSKATSLSSTLDLEGPKTFYWRMQLKTYMAMTGARVGRLLVLHLLGDYLYAKSPEPGPHFRVYEMRCTETELVEHWELVVVPTAARLQRAAREGKTE
jgi:hypothetical protein